jgi:hypothetical protein
MTTPIKLRSGSYIAANYRLLDGSMHFAPLMHVYSQTEFAKFPKAYVYIDKPCLTCGQRTKHMLAISTPNPDCGIRCTDCVALATATKTSYAAYN